MMEGLDRLAVSVSLDRLAVLVARAASAERELSRLSYNPRLKAFAVAEAKLAAFCQAAEAIGLSDTAAAFRMAVRDAQQQCPFPPDHCGSQVYAAWKRNITVRVLHQLELDLSQVLYYAQAKSLAGAGHPYRREAEQGAIKCGSCCLTGR